MNKQICCNIRKLRFENKLTQKEVAELLGIKQNTYSQKENCLIDWSIEELATISELYGVTVDDLINKNEATICA